MKPLVAVVLAGLCSMDAAQDGGGLQHRNTYSEAYGAAKAAVAVDPAAELPRYPAVAAKDAISTWKVKAGFRLELAAHEPQVRDPIAICFDENGRMFVCEMIDYSEMRDTQPHLGRISLLEDRDGDGYYETSRVFADDLPWPTGLIWANGGLYVGATPDIWRLEDRDGDGRAEVREKVFTGFGRGLQRLNVQSLLNSFQWGQDNRVHVQSASGNRGLISSPMRPDLPAVELGGRDFWFDPRTHAFGFEIGGAQYGMSFDDYGRKFGCSNSDHLQFWVYDDRQAGRNPFFSLPAARQSIAADGGAAEVFRISPDEPWRIVRTRWRIGGVVKGVVEGGGRVSGYFTGASGTTVYRGDAYGEDFVNNTFTGDAGGQLIHRKKLSPDGVSLIGRRPDDEQGFEFAASTDTWVRVVNFANAPDGCLHVCDMYREVIEHPWSIPEQIKRHLDLNNGNDRGRIYRIAPAGSDWRRRASVRLGAADTATLVAMLEHANGWHRDTASRLLYERQDGSAVPLLRKLVRESASPKGRHHALGALDGLRSLDADTLAIALGDRDAHVRERALALTDDAARGGAASAVLRDALCGLVADPEPRVRFQLAFALQSALAAPLVAEEADCLADSYMRLAKRDYSDPWISAALLSGPPSVVVGPLFALVNSDRDFAAGAADFTAHLIEIKAESQPASEGAALIDFVTRPEVRPEWIRALGAGLRRAGTSIEAIDSEGRLAALFSRSAANAIDGSLGDAARISAIRALSVSDARDSRSALVACLGTAHPESVQLAAMDALSTGGDEGAASAVLDAWPGFSDTAKARALSMLGAREAWTLALLRAVSAGRVKPDEISAAQVQSLANHPAAAVSALAREALASVLPPSREEVAAKFKPSLGLAGSAAKGQEIYAGRCMVCHRAAGLGMALGPDLVTVKSKGREALLEAILDPNKEVAPQFIAYDFTTKEGNAYTGLIARDEASSVTLKIMGGAELTLARADLRASVSSGKSIMPEGLEAGLSVEDMAHLLTFIEELR